MYGAIFGDIAGSIYEFDDKKTDKPEKIELLNSKCCFTDDTVLTIAIAESLLLDIPYTESIKKWANRYPNAGYGGMFRNWMYSENLEPYNSYGNGSAMRVSSIGWLFNTLEETLDEAKKSAEVTHNHPEGIKGAQAIAAAIWMARKKETKESIKNYLSAYGYNLDRKLSDIRPAYKFDETCQGSVPEAIICFLESHDFTSTIQNALSIGGDSDTIACMAGAIAEAFYGMPNEYKEFVDCKLDTSLLDVLDKFIKYVVK